MSEITITLRITLPEGATVNVVPPRTVSGGASVPGPSARPAVDQGVCPDGHGPWHFVPAGVSKASGKSFTSFWGCTERNCKRRPPIGWVAAATSESPAEEPYWNDAPVEVPF